MKIVGRIGNPTHIYGGVISSRLNRVHFLIPPTRSYQKTTMKTQITRGILLAAILISILLPGAPRRAAQATAVSPQTLLNADGTLKLDGAVNGVLDLQGYNVTLDPAKGPVFGPTSGDAVTTLPGEWANVGEGGGAVDAAVRDIVVSGTAVYVGGDFTDVANIPEADFVAKWNGTNWSALGSNGAGDGALSSSVYALLADGQDLYIGGSFNNVNNNGTQLNTADYIAKWNETSQSWSALGSNGAGDGALTATVYDLALSGTTLYVGGSFTNVNNNGIVVPEADYIVSWDGANWAALGSDGAGNGALNTLVDAIAINGTEVYVGGYFTNVNNGGTVLTAADFVARWDGANWSALGSDGASNGAINSFVYTLAVSGTDLYVGGLFTNVNNNGTPLPEADFITKWDGASWSALGSNGAGDGALNSYILTLLVDDSDVYVGGAFTNASNGGTAVNNADYLAKWDGANWSALGNNGAGNGAIPSKSTPYIAALALDGSNLFAGGAFFDLDNGGSVLPQADYIARWNTGTSAWSSLGTAANGSLVNGYTASQVNAIAVMGTAVYVGGFFSNISNHGINIPEADYIVKWDGTNWSALGSNGAGNGSLFNRVQALAVNGTDLYVGGTFINVNNNGVMLPTADYIAKWDTLSESWSALGSNGAGNGALPSGSSVAALAFNGSTLVVGGGFTNVNNNGTVIPEADYIAQWDGANWSALGSNGAGDGALNAYVAALAVDGATLYAGGNFTNAAALPAADYVARWNGSSWSALGSNGAGDGSLNDGVAAIAAAGSSLYVGGFFTNVNNGGTVLNTADLIAEWDTGTGNWSALGSNGLGDGVFCIACGSSIATVFVNGTDVYVGGTFTNLNSNGAVLDAADYIAKWDGTSWTALGSNGAGNGAIPTMINTRVQAITTLGTDLLVGGNMANLSNNGAALPEADYLATYGISNEGPDTTPPTVVSVTRLDANPTSATTVRFLVTFSESVSGLDASNFQLATSGITGATVIQMGPFINGIGPITVSTGSGVGTIRLDVIDDDTIKDAAGLPLGGVGLDNGTFTSGEVYQVQLRQLYLPLVLR